MIALFYLSTRVPVLVMIYDVDTRDRHQWETNINCFIKKTQATCWGSGNCDNVENLCETIAHCCCIFCGCNYYLSVLLLHFFALGYRPNPIVSLQQVNQYIFRCTVKYIIFYYMQNVVAVVLWSNDSSLPQCSPYILLCWTFTFVSLYPPYVEWLASQFFRCPNTPLCPLCSYLLFHLFAFKRLLALVR